jgi:hypothetical protein
MSRLKRIGECKRCGACCLYLWYEMPKEEAENGYWKTRGAEIVTDPTNPKNSIVGVHAPCKHIHRHKGGTTYCDIYGTDQYPIGCRNYPPENNPNPHFVSIKKSLGCGFDYITEEEEKKMAEVNMAAFQMPKEEAERLHKEWTTRARGMFEEMVREGGTPGAFLAISIFRELVQQAEGKTSNLITLNLYMEEWTKNFKENLLAGYFSEDKRWITDVMMPKHILCVGAGPSLTNEQIDAMKDFKGCIICVNKSVKRLLERGVVPTIVTCIHGTEEVLPSFTPDIVRENLHKSYVVLCTTTHPGVVKEIMEHCDRKKLYFCHASTPQEYAANLDNLYQSLYNVPVLDTGGNVGLFNISMSMHFKPKVLGFVGMELCQTFEESVKNNQDMLESYLLRFPEDGNMEFVMSKVWRTYVQVLMDWYGEGRKANNDVFPFDIINLTPRGLIYIRRKEWIPYMPIEEFVKQYGALE